MQTRPDRVLRLTSTTTLRDPECAKNKINAQKIRPPPRLVMDRKFGVWIELRSHGPPDYWSCGCSRFFWNPEGGGLAIGFQSSLKRRQRPYAGVAAPHSSLGLLGWWARWSWRRCASWFWRWCATTTSVRYSVRCWLALSRGWFLSHGFYLGVCGHTRQKCKSRLGAQSLLALKDIVLWCRALLQPIEQPRLPQKPSAPAALLRPGKTSQANQLPC